MHYVKLRTHYGAVKITVQPSAIDQDIRKRGLHNLHKNVSNSADAEPPQPHLPVPPVASVVEVQSDLQSGHAGGEKCQQEEVLEALSVSKDTDHHFQEMQKPQSPQNAQPPPPPTWTRH